MAKWKDDPAVIALVEAATSKAVKAEFKRVSGIVKQIDFLDGAKASAVRKQIREALAA